jgi:hypothetical protein
MVRLRRNDSWRLFTRRITACVALVCYLATAVGFPVPSPQAKDRGQPFPCQDHPCGCQTAEQCWRHCCCFSPQERLAWAEAQRIEPPSYVERPAANGWHIARSRDRTGVGEERSGCTNCRSRPTCQVCLPLARKNCCGNREDVVPCCSQESARGRESARPKPPARIPWVLGVAGLRCQGVTTLWVSIGAVLPPPTPLEWSDLLLPIGWLSRRDASSVPLLLTPPDPPPRLSNA